MDFPLILLTLFFGELSKNGTPTQRHLDLSTSSSQSIYRRISSPARARHRNSPFYPSFTISMASAYAGKVFLEDLVASSDPQAKSSENCDILEEDWVVQCARRHCVQSAGNQDTISTKIATSRMQNNASRNRNMFSKLLYHIQSTMCNEYMIYSFKNGPLEPKQCKIQQLTTYRLPKHTKLASSNARIC